MLPIYVLLIGLLFAAIFITAIPNRVLTSKSAIVIITLSVFLTFIWVSPPLHDTVADQQGFDKWKYVAVYLLFAAVVVAYVFDCVGTCSRDGNSLQS